MKLLSYLESSVFQRSRQLAVGLLSNRVRLIALLGQMSRKFREIEDKEKFARDVKDKFFVFTRLLKAFVTGQYKSISWHAALSIIAAALYFVNPADIIPDIIPLSGFLDDFSILIWTYNSLQDEIEKFLKGENNNR